jgi:4-hydroxybenzoate polyprenyltransferase
MHSAILDRLDAYVRLVRLNRPIGILLLLWPTLWALWIAAAGWPDLRVLGVFLGGVVLMRSAGCAINDYADRAIDAHVSRTRERPLATGRVSPREALVVAGVLALLAFGLVLLTNRLTVLLSLAGAFLAATYPFTKRLTHMPQAYLGAAFGWAVPMAFAAQTGEVPAGAWLIFLATLLWAIAYDTMYAMADREDDLKLGVRSSAILFGRRDRLMIGILQGLVLGVLALSGMHFGMRLPFYVGLLATVPFALYQQHLIREREPARCFQAFLNNSWIGAVIYLGIVLDYWTRSAELES